MANLETKWMGLKLKSPLIAGSCPLNSKLDNLKTLEAAGAGAVVLPSLFEEQILASGQDLDKGLNLGTESYAEALSFFPDMDHYNLGTGLYLDRIRAAKDAVSIPIIASLNGVHPGSWCEFGLAMQEAGADALELNFYALNTDPAVTAAHAEKELADLVRSTASCLSIPVSVKLAPFFTCLPNLARRLKGTGAKGLVLFNRFFNPDLDLDSRGPVPKLAKSPPEALWLRLRWTAILYGTVKVDLGLSGGVNRPEDAVKAILSGASAVQVTSILYEKGPGHMRKLVDGLSRWFDRNGCGGVADAKGTMSRQSVEDPQAFERANYLKVLRAFEADQD